MEVVKTSLLTKQCNKVYNDGIFIATKLRAKEVNCAHVMLAILMNNDEINEEFTRISHTDQEKFALKLDELYETGVFETVDPSTVKDDEAYLTLDNTSDCLRQISIAMLQEADKTNKRSDTYRLFNELMTREDSEVFTVLKALGIEPGDIDKDPHPMSRMPLSRTVGYDMTVAAREGQFDAIAGRDTEINKMIEVLGRRQKANPCLIGEPGVGKTAIVEGLAQRIADGTVPYYLKNKHIISLDITSIVGGSRYRGDFEKKMNTVLMEIESAGNCIIFFDEIHMLIGAGAGGNNEGSDAANLLKPALHRGGIKMIGTTTTKEYSRLIASDGAFERRMQSIPVNEPTVDIAYEMVKTVVPVYAKYHNCKFSDSVLKAAVVLSDRYITNRRLPDKAISVIDETAARLKAGNNGEMCEASIDDIRDTISKLSGVDVADIDSTSKSKIELLDKSLHKAIIGQDRAIEGVVKAIKRSKAGIKDPNRPIGSFLFVGPTGVGKTELTKQLAKQYCGDTRYLIKLDMSEYMEKIAASRLTGSPPGYVGYDDGGQLTEAVKHNPNSVVLFDEIEKAHPDVFNILLQILEDGILTDSKGVKVDFKNCIIIMTSNAGYSLEQKKASIGFGTTVEADDPDKIEADAIKALSSTFRPEFLNRIDKVVVFNALEKEDCSPIVNLELAKVAKRLLEKDIKMTWDNSIVKHILDEGYSKEYGARNLRRKAQEIIDDTLADMIIDCKITSGDTIKLSYTEDVNVDIEHSDDKHSDAEHSAIESCSEAVLY